MMLSKTKDNELAQQMLHLVVPIAIQQFMLALVSATEDLSTRHLFLPFLSQGRFNLFSISLLPALLLAAAL